MATTAHPHKRQRTQETSSSSSLSLYIPRPSEHEPLLPSSATTDSFSSGTIRTSSLSHPTMKLSGHTGSIYALSYSPDGECLASASFDMTCLLWKATGNCENFNVLQGHKNAVLDVKWSMDSEHIVTASADKHVAWWDGNTAERIKRFVGHEGIVNKIDVSHVSPKVVASASDDGTVKLWDARVKGATLTLDCQYPTTSVAFGMDGNAIYSAGIDNCITAWDLRTNNNEKSMKIQAHGDTITCLALHPKGTHLLSNSMDGTMKSWDIRPFVPNGSKRHCKTFVGGTHNAEKGLLNCAWSSDGSMVTGGSADKVVHIWDELTTEELYYLPGHKGCVNTVIFHPKEHVVASGSSDKAIYVGELSS